jgi:hypothetical protein
VQPVGPVCRSGAPLSPHPLMSMERNPQLLQLLYRYILLPTVTVSNVRFFKLVGASKTSSEIPLRSRWFVRANLPGELRSITEVLLCDRPNIRATGCRAKQFLLSVPCNEAVICLDYLALITHEWTSLEYVLNDTARRKSNCWEKALPPLLFAH